MTKNALLLLLPCILLLSTCRASIEPTQTILWEQDREGFVQFSTNDAQYLGSSFTAVYGVIQDPLGAVSAEVQKNSGNPMGGFGLVFCYQDADNYYLLCIDVQGFYAVYRRASGWWSTMANWQYCGALNKGHGAVNTLGVSYHRQDSTFSIFVNDSLATTFQDTRFSGGKYGYSVDVLSGGYEQFPENPVDVRFKLTAASGITVSPTSGLVTTEAGGAAGFTVVLDSKPSANVTIELWNSDPTEGTVSPSALVFTPEDWAVAQTVTVTGVDDLVDDENRLYTIATLPAASSDPVYDGVDARDVQVSNTDDDPPAAPGNLIATATSSDQNDLAWSDNSTNEDGFKIERKLGAQGSYAEIAMVAASVSSYSDSGITRVPGDTYYYRVRTYNAAGNSGYSNEATTMRTLAPSDSPGDFGRAVAISGDYAVVGATEAAYIFHASGANSWDAGIKLLSPEPETGASFGCSVAIDGDYAIVGASNKDEGAADAGAIYVFRRAGTNAWDGGTKIAAPTPQANAHFGAKVRISGDYLIAASNGKAYIFQRTGENGWDGGVTLAPPDSYGSSSFGLAVAIDGDYAVVGDRSDYQQSLSGAAFIFHRTGPNAWGEHTKILSPDGGAGDWFGGDVAISGEYCVVGAEQHDALQNNSGAAYVFHRTGTNSWDAGTEILPNSYGFYCGRAVAIEGDHVVLGVEADGQGGPYSGAVYFFHRTDVNSWDSSRKWQGQWYASIGHSVGVEGGRVIVGYGVYVLY
jgi:hypothetical protein